MAKPEPIATATSSRGNVQLGVSVIVLLASIGWVYINKQDPVTEPVYSISKEKARNSIASISLATSTSAKLIRSSHLLSSHENFPMYPEKCATSGKNFQPDNEYKMNCSVGLPGVFYNYVFATETGCVDSKTRSIHGLWPNYFNTSETGGYNWPQFCGTEELKMSNLDTVPGLVDRLHQVWKSCPPNPGDRTQDELDFSFWSHEWFRHGSCSGYSQAEYFTKVVNLFDEMRPSLQKVCESKHESCDVHVSYDQVDVLPGEVTAKNSDDAFVKNEGSSYCKPEQACWPSEKDIVDLRNKLNGHSKRNLNWNGYPQAQPCSVPVDSSFSQSLYGLGNNCTEINALYYNEELGKECYTGSNPEDYNESKDHCKAATRNQPYESWTPAFIAFCENSDQIRSALEFALNHNLCVMVASTGHDYLNRHSCPTGGMMIRTTAMKGMEYLENWTQNPTEAPNGAFRFGVGLTFSEAHKFAAENNRVISSGWCNTVGLIGWSLGGGHGPLAPSLGLGVDNTLEFTVMQVHEDDDGQKQVKEVLVNSDSNPSLFWAMKGGGGSTWGVVTSIAVRAHPIPEGKFTQFNISTHGTFCDETRKENEHNFAWLKEMWQKYAEWQLTLNEKFSIQTSVWPQKGHDYCNRRWDVVLTYIYNGGKDDLAQVTAQEALVKILQPGADDAQDLITLSSFYDEVTQYKGNTFAIRPSPAKPTNENITGAQSSALISREMMKSNWSQVFSEILELCPKHNQCPFHYLYLAFTGNVGSPQPNNTALSPGMRSYLMLHNARNLTLTQLDSTLYRISNFSYFSESAYVMRNWSYRYWGGNYEQLREVKRRYDPFHIFTCHHCIGDDSVQ